MRVDIAPHPEGALPVYAQRSEVGHAAALFKDTLYGRARFPEYADENSTGF